jgi:hypothetical protein
MTDRVTHAEQFSALCGRDPRVDSEMVEVLDPIGDTCPSRKMLTAKVAEALLKPEEVNSIARVSGRHDAPRTRIGPLEIHVADAESDGIVFMLVEESILPERTHAVDFQGSPKPPPRFLQINFRKPVRHCS